ncbi:MAG TPA: S46 family peptidase, partial [Verrucomicrobiae bacterium]|nr:S46 family peptidase [Verrucomicrobiae bacterium]
PWLEHLQRSSIRFNSGGSGSFVSEDGLVISNHHVGADALQKFGDKDHNYLHDGFYAKSLADEKKCLDLELNVLISIEDVTARVNAAVKPDLKPAEAVVARRKVMAEIEKESLDKTGLRSDVVTLYQGGQYHLYRFKKYTDVRLVFAPEQQIAFFGGDPDNVEYPRFDLDICLFRAYENGKPAKVEHYLKWSKNGAAENELTFVSGHPGRTSRMMTMAELTYLRDNQFPYTLARLKRLEVLLGAYSARSEENARKAREDLFGVQNSRKARDGGHAGLYDPALMAKKEAAEKKFLAALGDKPEYAAARQAFDQIATAQAAIKQDALRYRLLEAHQGFDGSLYGIAQTILRAGDERPKPNGERLREFRDSAKESLEFSLFSDAPIYEDFEQLLLADSLTFLAEQLGADDPTVKKVLAGKSPRARATELILGTKLRDVATRKKLYEGGAAAVSAAKDPLIELARSIDEEARALRKQVEAQDEIKQQAHAAISKAKFAIEGTSAYPDATFTLRLAYGVAKGYEENGKHIPFETTMAGLYERAAEQKFKPPFDLPDRWLKRKGKLNLNTPFNFISTEDIIGGNSGSPVVNRAGEFVGIIFDGNIQSLVLDFDYTDVQARALSVHSSAILEGLRKVYDAGALADELTSGRRK